jgi:flagellar protein FliS
MTYGNKGISAYTKTQVSTTTSQKELIVMAYDGILRFLRQARGHIETNEFEQKHIMLCKARAVIEELAATLNREQGGQIATNLWNLYMFFLQKITEANFSNKVVHIDAILPPIQELRDGWAQMEVPKEDAKAQALDRRASMNETSHLSITG